jgi:hypothetical protein
MINFIFRALPETWQSEIESFMIWHVGRPLVHAWGSVVRLVRWR